MRRLAVTVLLALSCSAATGEAVIAVPFLLERNKVIIPTSVNKSKPLKLILDTGMRFDGVFLFHKEHIALIDATDALQVEVPGAGGGAPSTATLIESGTLEFGDVTVKKQQVLISSSPHTQSFPTDGVIGWNLFGHYNIEIDYDRRLIYLHDTSYQPSDAGWTMIPITVKKDIPWFTAQVQVVSGEPRELTVYVDLASGDALELLLKDNQKFSAPPELIADHLGTGLSGDIHGYRGEAVSIDIGGHVVSQFPAVFAPAHVRSKQDGADAVIGNGLMKYFNVIFAYPQNKLFIKPNGLYSEKQR